MWSDQRDKILIKLEWFLVSIDASVSTAPEHRPQKIRAGLWCWEMPELLSPGSLGLQRGTSCSLGRRWKWEWCPWAGNSEWMRSSAWWSLINPGWNATCWRLKKPVFTGWGALGWPSALGHVGGKIRMGCYSPQVITSQSKCRFNPREDLSNITVVSLAHNPSCHRFGSIASKLLPADRAISQSSGPVSWVKPKKPCYFAQSLTPACICQPVCFPSHRPTAVPKRPRAYQFSLHQELLAQTVWF